MKKSTFQMLSVIPAYFGSIGSLFRTHKQKIANFYIVTTAVYYLLTIVYSAVTFINVDLEVFYNEPVLKGYGDGMFKCISIWNNFVQISFYVGLSVTNYQLTTYPLDHWWIKYAKGYRRFLEKSFLSVVFPMSLFVCNTFWYVYHTNRELIYPKMIEKLVPAWYNHTIHTLPVLIVFLHLILVEPESSPLSMKTSMIIQTVFHAGYLSLMFHDRYMKGVWLYKFLGYYAETWTRALVTPILLSFVIPYIYVWIAYRINDELRPTVTKAKRKTTGKVSAKIKNKKQ
ncbi:hypothetical protein M8J75_010314 [Diaphorina citri]|nr:hypothetical protein M8J75_010314 [Diaphorina citri]